MSEKILQLKRGTAERWYTVNPILAIGEPGFVYDANKLKIGDGVTPWNELPYIDSIGQHHRSLLTRFFFKQALLKFEIAFGHFFLRLVSRPGKLYRFLEGCRLVIDKVKRAFAVSQDILRGI